MHTRILNPTHNLLGTFAQVSSMYRAYLDSTLLADDAVMDVDATRAVFPEARTLQQWVSSEGIGAVEITQ